MKNFKSLSEFQKYFQTSLGKGMSRELLLGFFLEFKRYIRSSSVLTSIITIESRYNNLFESHRKGTLTYDYFSAKKAGVVESLLSLISELNLDDIYLSDKDVILAQALHKLKQRKEGKKNNLGIAPERTILREAIKEADFDEEKATRLNLVNCDRKEPNQLYWEGFEKKEKEPFQFYFINGCSSQQPQSLAERVIYELEKEKEEEGDEGAILSELKGDSQRIKFIEFPLKATLKRSQKALKNYFANRFKIQNKSLEEFIKEEIIKYDSYDYIKTVFISDISQWNRHTAKYLDWMIDKFKDNRTNAPSFIFYIIFHMDDLHLNRSQYKDIIAELEKLAIKHSKTTTLIDNLKTVPVHLVEVWIKKMGELRPAKIDDLILKLAYTLATEEKQKRFHEKGEFDMSDVELFQEEVMDVLNSQ